MIELESFGDVGGDQMADRVKALFAHRDDAQTADRERVEDAIVRSMLPFALRLARRYRGRGVDVEDLESVARVALVAAMRRFDAGNGTFMAYAHATINGELKRHFRDHAWSIRPSRAVQDLRPRVQQAVEQRQSAGIPVDSSEIAAELGSSRGAVIEALRAGRLFDVDSLDVATTADGSVRETVADPTNLFEWVDDRDMLRRCCQDLTDTDRRLLQLRFGDELSQADIGEIFGISQMQVSRRLSAVIAKLRAKLAEPTPQAA